MRTALLVILWCLGAVGLLGSMVAGGEGSPVASAMFFMTSVACFVVLLLQTPKVPPAGKA